MLTTEHCFMCLTTPVVWPSGPRRWIKAPVSYEAWVRIPPLPAFSKTWPGQAWLKMCWLVCEMEWFLGVK